jgi:hypothetical protein
MRAHNEATELQSAAWYRRKATGSAPAIIVFSRADRSQHNPAALPDKAAATLTIHREPGCFSRPNEHSASMRVVSAHGGYPMTEIKEHMEVIGADGVHVGTVDKVEGRRIKLTKKDSGEGSHRGHHHYIDRGFVAGVEGNKVRLSAIGAVAVTLEEEKG